MLSYRVAVILSMILPMDMDIVTALVLLDVGYYFSYIN